MRVINTRPFHQNNRNVFVAKISMCLLIAASILSLAGCGGGGGGTSSNSGGVSLSGSKTMVQGNINSIGSGLAFNVDQSESFSIVKVLKLLGSGIIQNAVAADQVVEGIEVCIESFCTLTDSNGSFLLDLGGTAGGIYPISFSFDGTTYTSDIEVIDDALVTMENISISDDGVVRVNSVRVALVEDDELPDDGDVPSIPDVDDDIDEEVAVTKVPVCHRPGTSAEKTLFLPTSALKGHLGHGDSEGECAEE